ncbi:MAG: DUF5107 domain-containing protein [Candidatus Aminicenantes bacterium]|nr:DUF5107 domain-containing protein [Candidatus Aminicenantes bacterium]
MRKILIFCAVFLILAGIFWAEVHVEETKMEILTYAVGPDDPNPPLWESNVYPYPLQTDITREKFMREYRVIILENEFIKVLILPDLGGRIYAAFDKTNDNFDFIYHNRVIKPGLVALRGAWLSGGIEWNFPTRGHTVDTFSPVNSKILKGGDGSISCVVGTEEWVRRMKWQVFITVSPGCSAFKTKVCLFNRTLTHNLAYFWSNAAVHAWDDTRIFFPPADYTYAGRRRNPTPWPTYEGKDRSWYRTTARPYDYFCGTPGDFNGAYNTLKDHGTVHYAYRFDSPGKKFWTWGTAPSGTIWERLLTDDDGPYIEIQGGRLLTQGDTWIFEPHLVETWEEYWYPVKNMHGVVKANPEAAVNLEIKNTGILFAVNVTRRFEEAQVTIERGGEDIFSEKVTLSPENFIRRDIPNEWEAGPYILTVLDKNGRKIISYTNKRPDIPEPELQPDFSENQSGSVQVEYLKGYYAMKNWDEEGAVYHFTRCLKKEPDFFPAIKWLGILRYKSGLTKEALSLFEDVLKRDEDDYVARYYRGLCKIRLGIIDRTEEDLYKVERRAAFRHIGPYVLASKKLADKDYQEAEEFLRKCLRVNPQDVKAEVFLAAVKRHIGDEEEAWKHVFSALEKDPLSPVALAEREMLGGEAPWGELSDPQYAIESSCDYLEMNLLEDAAACLESRRAWNKEKIHPLVDYYLGYIYWHLNKEEKSSTFFKKGSEGEPDYVFPFRTETESVMRKALEVNPDDWKASYYLGNLLTAKNRWKEGLESYKKAALRAPLFSVLYRNLGEIYRVRLKDYDNAERMYEKAVSLSPKDYRLYVVLDETYAVQNKQKSRDNLYSQAPEKVRKNFNVVLQRALFLIDTNRFDETLILLGENTFLPWEGWTGAREVYVLALLNRARNKMSQEFYRDAVEDIRKAMEYPENLGTGRPAESVFSREYYLLGLCYEGLGDIEEAENCFVTSQSFPVSPNSEQVYFKAMAMKKMNRSEDAERLLQDMKTAGEKSLEHAWRGRSVYYLRTALAAAGLGDREKARELFGRAYEENPSDRWVSYYASIIHKFGLVL